ncbi:MAG: YfiR family protein [Bryobacteraceae bacterium]
MCASFSKALRVAITLALCGTWISGPSAIHAKPPISPEYIIKAAYIYNFAMFVEWPPDAFARDDAPIVIGIVGADPFGSALEETVRDKRVNRKRFVIKRVQGGQDLRDCHIVFFNSAESERLGEIPNQLRGLPVLLVGEGPAFAKRGGMINFVLENKRVLCEINVAAAKRARLAIDSKLLSIAKIVDAVI